MLETDSDGDGIPDSIEVVLGSNPTNTNSDGDDAPDIVEYAICQMENGTDCKDISSTTGKAKCKCATMNDKNDSPTTRGDFVFTTPFKKASTPNKQTLSLETSIQTIDLFFLFDSTSSMSDELASLKTSLPTIIHELHCDDLGRACTENNDCKGLTNAICSEKGRCITNPSTGCFDNMYTGLGGYNTIHTLFISQALDPDVEKTITAINNFSWRGDYEAPYSGVICTALKKGEDNTLCAHTTNTCNTSSDRIGCTGFRKDAIRVLLHAFDENQCYSYWSPGTTNYQNYKPKCETVKANVGTVLKNKKIRYVGLWSPSWEPTAVSHFDDGWTNDLVAEYIGINSGSVNTATPPVPFVYKAKDSDLANKAKSGILEIAKNMPMNITADVEDFDKTDNLNASQLISKLVVNLEDGKVAQNRRCTKITNTIDKTTNPKYEGVKDLLPGNTLCYDVIPVQNQSLFPADKVIPKIYKARVKVIGDGSVLNSGVAYFVVPPELEGSNE
jgi:hypothetical protein